MSFGDERVSAELAGLAGEELLGLIVRAQTVHGLLGDRDPGNDFSGSRVGKIGSAKLARRFDPNAEAVLHAAALLLGLDFGDAKWLHSAGIPTPIVQRLDSLASAWLSDDRDAPDFLDRWEALLLSRFTATEPVQKGRTGPTRSARIVVLTGAGISAESGLSTFRDAGGLWEQHRIEDVASPRAFKRNPEMVHRFYDTRRAQLKDVRPNSAHYALARLEKVFPGEVLIITQNVDDLHEDAGSRNVIHMHGRLRSVLCTVCAKREDFSGELGTHPACRHCGARSLRPDIVWFGENVREADRIYAALAQCEVFAVIGTSGTVHPAAEFAETARANGAETVHINLEHFVDDEFDLSYEGPASTSVPNWVREVMLSHGTTDPESNEGRDRSGELLQAIEDFVDGEVFQASHDWGIYSPRGLSSLLEEIGVPSVDRHPATSELEQVISELIGVINSGEAGNETLVAFMQSHGARTASIRAELKRARVEYAADLIAWLIAQPQPAVS